MHGEWRQETDRESAGRDKGWAEQSKAERENAGAGLRVGKDEDEVRGDEHKVEKRPRTRKGSGKELEEGQTQNPSGVTSHSLLPTQDRLPCPTHISAALGFLGGTGPGTPW